MKKVLIITYYWPPAGGSGVRRWLNFSNHLHEFGWQPIIFSPLDADYASVDESQEKCIHEKTIILKSKIFEPFKIYSKFIGKKNVGIPGALLSSEDAGIKERISLWIRSNFFIPDARMFWISPGTKFLNKYLEKNTVDLIVSTGPPHTTHLIALKVSKKNSIPWIADFRDPWTKIDFFHKLNLHPIALQRHKKLEKSVLEKSTMQTTVSWSWAEDFVEMGAKNVKVVTNGFDPVSIPTKPVRLDDKFTITHIGSMNDDRNHPEFWKALAELIVFDENFKDKIKIQLYGGIVDSVKKEIEKNNLEEYCIHVPFVNHTEAMQVISTSRVLYLAINNAPNISGIVPGKIFEYIAVQRPIFAIGSPSGDFAKVLKMAQNGIICNFGDFSNIKSSLYSLFKDYCDSKDEVSSDAYKQFSRLEIVKNMVEYMNAAIKL